MSLSLLRCTLLIALALAGGARAAGGNVGDRIAPGTISTAEQAAAALGSLESERAAVQARYAQEEAACHSEFFMTRCLERARERRRQALRPLEALEVEANRFLRQQRALERERALVERRSDAERREREAVAQQSAPQPPRTMPQPVPEAAPDVSARVARPVASIEQQREQARRRAQNEADYARKVQAARERQAAIARNKAEKERRRSQTQQ